MPDLEVSSELWHRGCILSELWGWKYIGMVVLIFRPQDTTYRPPRTPFSSGKTCWACIWKDLKRTWKGSKTIKNSLFGHLMHSVASLSTSLIFVYYTKRRTHSQRKNNLNKNTCADGKNGPTKKMSQKSQRCFWTPQNLFARTRHTQK